MLKEASFVRTDTAAGARFDVTPVPKVRALGCLVGGCYVMAGGLVLVGLVLGDGAVLPLGIIWGPMLLIGALIHWSQADKYPRAPVSLLVNSSGIRIGERLFDAKSIVELLVRHPSGREPSSSVVAPTSVGVAVGQALRETHYNRSLALMARLKSSSVPEVLVFGLTYNTGVALMNDVSAALRS